MAAPPTNVQGLQFRVALPGGKVESLTVDSDRVLLGSGAHCEIRLPSEHAAVEHVLLTFTGGAIHAEARTLDNLPTLNGVAFTQTPLPEGAVIGIGQVQVTIAVVSIEDNANVIKKKTEQSSPFVYILALIAIPVCGYVLLVDDDSNATPNAPPDVPALFETATPKCAVQDEDQALAFARNQDFIAHGKRERRPFAVEDGVAAVPLFLLAAACYKRGGDPDAAQEARDEADDLIASVNADYRAHQVRLEHALSVKDFITARKEVHVLRAFTKGQKAKYVDWLSDLDRRLQLQLGRKPS